MTTTPELTVAQEAARAAGAILTRYFREGVAMRTKGVADLVSDADVEAERAVVRTIRDAFPGHDILGEEEAGGADVGAEHLWIVDPLDGTNNFAHKVPHFAVSIAYYRAGRAECGVVLNPIRDDWHVAVRGGGAYQNGVRAAVGAEAGLGEVLVGVGFYYDRGRMMRATLDAIGAFKERQIHGIRRMGTASLDLCMVGLGQFGAYFEYELSPWDFAAGRLFVEEAGGRVTDARGNPLPIGKSSVLATNGRLHEAALEIVAPRHPASA